MEPTIPTSFIPKRPIEPGAPSANLEHPPRRGITSLVSFLIIVIVVGMVIGSYFYEASLQTQVNAAQAALVNARDGIGTDFVSDMKRLDDRISTVKTLLDEHIVVTPIFKALQATTLRSVQYTDFTYSLNSEDEEGATDVAVTLSGITKAYATLALQSDAFLGSTLIKNPVFSELELDDTTKNIKFKLKFTVDASALSYERFIATLSAPVVPTSSATDQSASANQSVQ
jgi:hypothetical protein